MVAGVVFILTMTKKEPKEGTYILITRNPLISPGKYRLHPRGFNFRVTQDYDLLDELACITDGYKQKTVNNSELLLVMQSHFNHSKAYPEAAHANHRSILLGELFTSLHQCSMPGGVAVVSREWKAGDFKPDRNKSTKATFVGSNLIDLSDCLAW